MQLRRIALLVVLALLGGGLVVLAWLAGASVRQLLVFVAIVGVAAWGWGRDTRVTVRTPRTPQPAEADAIAAENSRTDAGRF